MATNTTTIQQKIAALRVMQRRGPVALQHKASPFLWPDFRSGRAEWHLINLEDYIAEGFNLNTLVYSAIMYKVRALSQVPLRAYTGDVDHPDPLDADHPLSKLVARPNPHQSFIEFQGQNAVYLNLSGNCYVAMVRPRPDELAEAMYSLRPDRVFVIPDKGKRRQGSGIMGYLYVPEGRSQWVRWSTSQRRQALGDSKVLPIPPQSMMHVKLPNPGDPLEGMGYGLSPLSPAARSADVDNKVTHFLKLFFDHGAMPQGMVSFDTPVDPLDFGPLREQWKDVYGGYENWDEVLFVGHGAKYQRITPAFDEMGFETIDERNESRILGPFGVPPILVGSRIGLNRATYANAELARRQCWEDTLVPESKLFEVEYKYYLAGQDSEFVAYDYSSVPALQKDIPALIVAWKDLVVNGVPKDIAAQVVGLPLPPLPDDGIGYMPLNLMPISIGSAEPARTEEGAASATDEERTEEGKLVVPDLSVKKNVRLN